MVNLADGRVTGVTGFTGCLNKLNSITSNRRTLFQFRHIFTAELIDDFKTAIRIIDHWSTLSVRRSAKKIESLTVRRVSLRKTFNRFIAKNYFIATVQ